MQKFNLLILFFTLLSSSIFSQDNIYNFLRLDYSPRAAALAGSFISNHDDPNVIFYNPAGLNSLEGEPISFSFVKHLLDINSASLTYSKKYENIGRFGAGVQYINYGNFVEADILGNKTGEFGVGELALVLGYSNVIDKNFTYGVNVKFIYSKIADYSSTGVATDIGFQYHIPEERWSFGVSALNIGSQLSNYIDASEDLPLDVRVGFSKSLKHLPLTFYASLNKLNKKQDKFSDRFKQFTFGGEFKLSKVITARVGYNNEQRKDLKIGNSAGLAGFNLGVGINIKKYVFDYAFTSLGSIGGLHRIGLSTKI